jgi:DNA-binding NarL/FixJ family response regulator
VPSASIDQVKVLVMSQHDAVRLQLVMYLGRSPSLTISGDAFSADAIVQSAPDVLVLDLSQLGHEQLHQAIDAAHRTGARLIALASIREPTAERAVIQAGGLYRLKSAGADGLAEVVGEVACRARAQSRRANDLSATYIGPESAALAPRVAAP